MPEMLLSGQFRLNESLVMRKLAFAYAKTKTQISCAVTAQLISAFVFAIRIVQSLFYLNPKFQASNHLLWLYSLECVGPVGNPEDRFSHDEGHKIFDNLAPRSTVFYRFKQCVVLFIFIPRIF